MAEKTELNELTDLLTLVEISVKNSPDIPEKDHKKWISRLQKFAKAGHDIGKVGVTRI